MRLFLFVLLFVVASVFNAMSHPSWGIVVDDEGNIYFADIGHNGMGSLWKLDNYGKLELILSNFHAHNVSFDRDGNIISAHGEETHIMIKYDHNGKLDTLHSSTDYKEFNGGNCTYSTGAGIVFQANGFIWKIENGKKKKMSPYKLEWNQTIFADKDGNIYATDKAKFGGSIVKIGPEGEAKIIARNLISILDRPIDKYNDVLLGINKDEDDFVYVAESAGKRIIKILNNGDTEDFYRSQGNWFPTGVYFKDCEAYILEYGFGPKGMIGPQIVKITKKNNKEILFNYEHYHQKKARR